MMSMSSREPGRSATSIPVKSFSYRDIAAPVIAKDAKPVPDKPSAPSMSATEINELVNRTRLEAVAETEARLSAEYEARSAQEAEKIRRALEQFQIERKDYFTRVESDVVQLALSVASKILHRESQVDPMLVAALVRVAIDKLHDGSSVSVRVPPSQAAKWSVFLANPLNGSTIEIVEDAHLGVGDCILETELGSANFNIDAQMKEVEQGFFDLLAQRPILK